MNNCSECSDCQWLLHYEWDEITRRHDMPRCSTGFRKGVDVKHPCPDYKKKEVRPPSSRTRVRDSYLG